MEHTSQRLPTRKRLVTGTRPGNSVTTCYFVKTNKGIASVCSAAFLKILGISRFRVQNLSRNFINTGSIPKENRGDDKRSNVFRSHNDAVVITLHLGIPRS
ncbi:hypothetical protein ANN_03907 [Periplaneta americana]|uniref:Uncharacterized protein n=1 Tax=Periplaneta americana TaxID=6978 RepID=A0ABQ8T8N4_PERAM|nr:hypothetical protein ANN_03907 [Periplaneta americana]